MAVYSYVGYAPDIISFLGGTVTLSASFDPDTDRRIFTVTDDPGGTTFAGRPDTGTIFDGDQFRNERGEDPDQTGVVTSIDGSTQFESGPIYLEEQYVLTNPSGGTINLYRVEVDGPGFPGIHVGFITSEPLDPGTSYTFSTVNVVGATAPDTTDPDALVDVPCFVKGTFIRTPQGEVEIDKLRVGDLVLTSDSGARIIKWIGSKTVEIDQRNAARLSPVRIRKGALSANTPTADLLVSPNHRILISRPENELLFGQYSVLVPAKHLLHIEGITKDDRHRCVTYYHFLFDRHEIVISNGAESESLHPGDIALGSVGRQAREEILSLFPELASASEIVRRPSATRILRKFEADLLTPA